MEILDTASLMGRAQQLGEHARLAQLYPFGSGAQNAALMAVDLLEIEATGSTPLMRHAEEHFLYVVQGNGELHTESGPAALLRPGSALYVGPREPHALKNTGAEKLRVLISTPLLVRSERALGLAPMPEPETTAVTPSSPEQVAPPPPTYAPEPDQSDAPLPDISGLLKRGSDIAATPRPERKRPLREPEPEPEPVQPQQPEPEPAEEAEEEEAHSALMELAVVFDGGSRGSPGQGYGSYLVQSPGRKPVVKHVEFGEGYTPPQAEYECLISCLQYIIERLTVTNRTPSQVALDIKSDSDSLVNQLQGNYKVKEANLRSRHAQAMELLEQFGEWMITWHAQEESVRLLGH